MTLLRNIFFLSSFIFSLFFLLEAMEKNEEGLTPLDTILQYHVELAKQLSEQPIFEGSGDGYAPSKVLLLDDWDDCLLSAILSRNARRIWEASWVIKSQSTLLAKKGNVLGNGISLWLVNDRALSPLHFVERAYKQVIEKLQNGWQRATLQEYPDILLRKPEDEWHLFVKTSDMWDEPSAVFLLAGKLGLDRQTIECDWLFATETCIKSKNPIYLWIEKDSFETFQSFFCLRIIG